MNTLITIDAKEVVPNLFALAIAAAARTRALRHGAEPRVHTEVEPGPHLALSEIAANAFAQEELAPFLPKAGTETPRLALHGALPKLCDGRPQATGAFAPEVGTVH